MAVIAVGRSEADSYTLVSLDALGTELVRDTIAASSLAEEVARREATDAPRWVLRSIRDEYSPLLAQGVRISRAHDLTLCHAILRDTALVTPALTADDAWRTSEQAIPDAAALFSFAERQGVTDTIEAVLAQYRAQLDVIARNPDQRLALLCLSESAGGLVAEEMRAAGLPWSETHHLRILEDTLGARPAGGGTPALMLHYANAVREALGDPRLSIDSQPKLLRALHRAGVSAESTSQWELTEHKHPAIAPLLAYKKLARLHSANGWAWLAEWVHQGRFRPVYVPGGVVTGRWASSGGGALQIPRALRPAVRADPGWKLIVADVAQLEPRMLAAMAQDHAMATAARGSDLYQGIVASGAVATREEAKYAVLGAMYGATTGDAGRLVPKLRTVYPQAMAVVDEAARRGEQGERVSTWLGRSCPPPSEAWRAVQSAASGAESTGADETRARRGARDRGRFTRNFVVQGTAAEWALIWLAEIRHRLWQLPKAQQQAAASGTVFGNRAHLAFFLHDEVIVHAPAEIADEAADAVREAAAVATRRLFGDAPIDVPLDLRIADCADK